MSYSSKGDRRYTPKQETPSRVLLVCVYDTVVFEITNQIIRGKFQKMGTIDKLLVFQKGEVTKLFIEYQSLEASVKAKQLLDGTKLCDSICKMTIYYSNFANVDIKHQNIECQVLNQQSKIARTHESERQDYTKSSNRDKDMFNQFFDEDETLQILRGMGQFPRSKTDNPKTLQEEFAKMNFKDDSTSPIIHQQDQIDHSIQRSIDNIIGTQNTYKNESAVKIKQEADVRSSILFFHIKYSLEPMMVYNLFSNFGNISCIKINKQTVYIKFRTKQFAAIANTYLNNMVLNGNIMNIKQSPQYLDSWKPMEGESCQCCYFDFTSDRFTPQRSITINPPSQTLHISSIKKQVCKENSLRDIFEEFGEVDRVHILHQSNQKNMALVKFRSLEGSFSAITNLHNRTISGRKMQISFTKSKV